MKNIIIVIFCFFVFIGCKKENTPFEKIKKASQEVKKATNDVKNVTSIIGGLDESKELMEKLKKLEPVNNEAWKNWLPEK